MLIRKPYHLIHGTHSAAWPSIALCNFVDIKGAKWHTFPLWWSSCHWSGPCVVRGEPIAADWQRIYAMWAMWNDSIAQFRRLSETYVSQYPAGRVWISKGQDWRYGAPLGPKCQKHVLCSFFHDPMPQIIHTKAESVHYISIRTILCIHQANYNHWQDN